MTARKERAFHKVIVIESRVASDRGAKREEKEAGPNRCEHDACEVGSGMPPKFPMNNGEVGVRLSRERNVPLEGGRLLVRNVAGNKHLSESRDLASGQTHIQ